MRMWRLPAMLCLVAAATATGLASDAPDSGTDLAPAMRAAEDWLRVVDAGSYGESWERSAAFVRETIPRTRWEVGVQRVREALGPMLHRKLRSATYTTLLPGAPAGEYVVIEFGTRFANRPLAVETVTPIREKDGTWKVSGYYVK